MKELDLGGSTYIRLVRFGTDEWYYAPDFPDGDLYEAAELHAEGKRVQGNDLYLIHYPDGKIYHPVPKSAELVFGEPVFMENAIYFPGVDFSTRLIHIFRFDCETKSTTEVDKLMLMTLKQCYNMRIFGPPLTLTRQPNDGTLEILWPEKKTFKIEQNESFFYRNGDKFYSSVWFEDPKYRVETYIRDANTGELLDSFRGDLHIMPNGDYWRTKG